MPDDFELLREHIVRGSDEAFRTLVERHSGMVHGAALRVVRNEHLADEITQAVFVILARKANGLRHGTILAGWLYRTARFVALEALRTEQRRQQHHQDFARMKDFTQTTSLWDQIAPLLEDAMHRLGAADRDAVVLRFLEEKSFAEVAGALGTSEAAAKMRVGRALEKLRTVLARRGVVVPAAALLGALSAHGASVAPSGLSATVATAALTQEAALESSLAALVKGGLQVLAWNKMKSGAIAAALAVLLSGVALVVQQPGSPRTNLGPVFVSSFEPMAGEWVGTFESRGGGQPNPVPQAATLSIRATRGGRSCEIEMRVGATAGRPASLYHFVHALNESGDRIVTVDDSQIGRMAGEGTITESSGDGKPGEWRATFRTQHNDRGGFTDCRWVRKGDELTITRHDQRTSPQGPTHFYSDLRLRRQAGANVVP
jgi:RNA polymerase sigma factor (sigma-70 family)